VQRLFANLLGLIGLVLLGIVIAWWGWRWFGPAQVHVAPAPVDDVVAALAASPLFAGGAPAARPDAAAAPTTLASDTRLMGVFAEAGGRGHALFRLPDGSSRLVAAGAALSGDATLVEVRPDGVLVRDGGGERSIALRAPPVATSAPPASPRPAGSKTSAACALPPNYKGPVVRLNAELVQGLISQPEGLRAIADSQDGALVIRDEAGFAAMLGMKKGDRVTQANGIALRAPDDVIVAVLRPLAASQPVRLVGSRGTQPRELMIINASACPN